MSCCFPINRQKQQTPEDTAVTYFLMLDSNLQTKYKKIISKPSLRSKEGISLRVSHVLRASHRVLQTLKRFSLGVFSIQECFLSRNVFNLGVFSMKECFQSSIQEYFQSTSVFNLGVFQECFLCQRINANKHSHFFLSYNSRKLKSSCQQ